MASSFLSTLCDSNAIKDSSLVIGNRLPSTDFTIFLNICQCPLNENLRVYLQRETLLNASYGGYNEKASGKREYAESNTD